MIPRQLEPGTNISFPVRLDHRVSTLGNKIVPIKAAIGQVLAAKQSAVSAKPTAGSDARPSRFSRKGDALMRTRRNSADIASIRVAGLGRRTNDMERRFRPIPDEISLLLQLSVEAREAGFVRGRGELGNEANGSERAGNAAGIECPSNFLVRRTVNCCRKVYTFVLSLIGAGGRRPAGQELVL